MSGHNALLCNDNDCHQNTLVACSLLKKQIARIAALEKGRAGLHHTLDLIARDVYQGMSWPEFARVTLAELDALNGDQP